MRNHRYLIVGLAGAFALGGAALAQQTEEVRFAPGDYGTMITGEITGQSFADYTLAARAGQEMFVELSVTETDGDGTVFFNVMAPGAEWEALYLGSMDDDSSETVALPLDGTYTIRVYLMGNDADAGKTVGYTLDLSIQ